MTANRQILLVETPKGKLGPEHFKLVQGTAPEPKDGDVLVRVLYISLDAANRAWMQGATYRSAVEANTVMAGGGVAEVVESKAQGFAKGDLVFADTGWQDFAALPAKQVIKIPRIEPLTYLLSVFGIAGPDRLLRPAECRPARSRRNRCRLGCGRLGGLDRRADRQVEGLPRGRHRRRHRQMQLAEERARLRCRRRLQGRAGVQGAEGSGAQRHRRLLRQCRRRYPRSLPVPDEQPRPHRLLRRHLAIRRRAASRRDRAACRA